LRFWFGFLLSSSLPVETFSPLRGRTSCLFFFPFIPPTADFQPGKSAPSCVKALTFCPPSVLVTRLFLGSCTTTSVLDSLPVSKGIFPTAVLRQCGVFMFFCSAANSGRHFDSGFSRNIRGIRQKLQLKGLALPAFSFRWASVEGTPRPPFFFGCSAQLRSMLPFLPAESVSGHCTSLGDNANCFDFCPPPPPLSYLLFSLLLQLLSNVGLVSPLKTGVLFARFLILTATPASTLCKQPSDAASCVA